MSLEQKIKKGVDKAFKAVGDLAKSAAFTRELTTGYDFQSGEINSTYEETTIDVIVTESVTLSDSTIESTLIAKNTETDLSKYSELTLEGVVYSIESIHRQIGVTTIKVRSR